MTSSIATAPLEGRGWERHTSLTTRATVALSAAYATLIVLFPWRLVQSLPFSDYLAYLDEFSTQAISKREIYQLTGLKEFYSFEVLWDELVRWLSRLTGDVSVALRLISFFILFVWAFYLLRRVRFGIALLFLFNPMEIDIAMSIIRNGLAWSLVIIGLTVQSRVVRYALFFLATFIHSSTLALLAIYGVTQLAARLWKGRTLAVTGLGTGVFIGLALTVGAQIVGAYFGDRRFSVGYALGGGSLLQPLMWLILLFLQFTSGNEYIRRNVFIMALLAWYETMNPFIPWSYRIWGAFLPVIGVSMLDLSARKRQLAFYSYCGYLALQWFYWSKLVYAHWA